MESHITSPSRWQDHKTLLYAWLLIFFPAGFYALWTGSIFDKQKKWMITGGIIFAVLVLGGAFDALLALILAPLAVFILWKDTSIKRPTVYKFAGGAVIILLLFLSAPDNQTGYDGGSSVLQDGNCTYYRDSSNNVIGRSCD